MLDLLGHCNARLHKAAQILLLPLSCHLHFGQFLMKSLLLRSALINGEVELGHHLFEVFGSKAHGCATRGSDAAAATTDILTILI
jgi:hypothetical protein